MAVSVSRHALPVRSARAKSALFAAALAVFLAGAPIAALAAPKVLRYASQDDPQTLDPHSANLLSTSRVTAQVYDPLVWRDRDWKTIPWLAVSWTQVSDKVWRFNLRDGVKFHDGAAFTADDVVFSIERALAPTSQMRSIVDGIAAVRRIDDLTVEFTLREPNPALLSHLTNVRIMNKAWCVKHNSAAPQNYTANEDTFASRNANGTGPFFVKRREPDVKTVLAAFPGWWGNKAGLNEGNLDEVVMLPVKSNATRMAGLLSGEVDFVIDPPTQDVQRLGGMPGFKVMQGAEVRVQYLAFDTFRDELLYSNVKGRNPFKDLRVRQAVAHAIDEEAIKSKVMRGMAVPIGSIITPKVQGYSPDGDVRPAYDRERARRLLAEAGYPDGFDVTLDCGNLQPAADICQSVAAMLTQAGIRTRPNIMPQATVFPKLERFDTSFYLLSWGAGVTSDAFYTLQVLLHSVAGKGNAGGEGGAAAGGGGDFNMGRYANPALDALLGKIKTESDMNRRNALIRDALLLANRELPVVPLHQPLIPWAMRSNVTTWFGPTNTVYFFRTRID